MLDMNNSLPSWMPSWTLYSSHVDLSFLNCTNAIPSPRAFPLLLQTPLQFSHQAHSYSLGLSLSRFLKEITPSPFIWSLYFLYNSKIFITCLHIPLDHKVSENLSSILYAQGLAQSLVWSRYLTNICFRNKDKLRNTYT